MTKLRTRRCPERGAVAVEFALVLPILVMLLFGIIEFGFVLAQKAALSSAVREGARYGSVNIFAENAGDPRDCGDVLTKSLENVSTLDMGKSDVTVEVKMGTSAAAASLVCASDGGGTSTDLPCQDATGEDNLYVIASYPATLNIPLTPIHTGITLQSTGAYRCEYSS
ncbi:MAG: TadE/TadG family type IV pilus assembly protein [Nocardioides sp.]